MTKKQIERIRKLKKEIKILKGPKTPIQIHFHFDRLEFDKVNEKTLEILKRLEKFI